MCRTRKVEEMLTSAKLGGFLGFSAGFFAKKVGKVMIFFVGGSLAALQYLQHLGWVTVHWNRIGESWNLKLDRDNDGKVTMKDVTSLTGAVIRWLTYRIPFAGGFTAGWWLGFRSG
jgi:uncharacterized membrane protein (Fun14 family)